MDKHSVTASSNYPGQAFRGLENELVYKTDTWVEIIEISSCSEYNFVWKMLKERLLKTNIFNLLTLPV